MQNVVGSTFVAVATKFGLGAEIQSPTDLQSFIVCITSQMLTTRRFFRRSLGFVLLVSGMLTICYVSIISVRSWDRNSSPFWSALNDLSSSVLVPQSDAAADDMQLLVRAPLGVSAEVHGKPCSGSSSVNSEHTDWQICRLLITGDTSSRMRPNYTITTATEYAQRTDDCDCFRSDFGYFVSPEDTSDEERRFPIAFSLLTYENLEQTERLLRLIYRPHNVYCIHVDAKSPAELHDGLEAIAGCLNNVFIAKPPMSTYWGKISVVHTEILCMRLLLHVHKGWKYFINLVGRDFPLRTNYELVKILQAYDGANDVHATRNEEK